MTKLKKYQLKGAKQIKNFGGRALLADEMGLGKTIQALYYCKKMRKSRPIVVVCPSSLKYNWQREARMHMGMSSIVLEGRKPKKGINLKAAPIVIINYDILEGWMKKLKKLNPRILIIDECHYVKNAEAARTIHCNKLSKISKYMIGISGTPLTNNPSELWSVLNMLYPKRFSSYFSFGVKYSHPKRVRGKWKFSGAKDLPKLHRTLKNTCMIRRKKKDVLKELSAKTRCVIPVIIDNMTAYNEANTDFLGVLGRESKAKAKRAARAEAITKLNYLMQLCVRNKMKLVTNWIDNFLQESDGKLIVFAKHKYVIKKLRDYYGSQQVHVFGTTTPKKRDLAVTQFQRNKKKRVFIGNIKSAGVGITLTAAETVLFAELDWVPANLTQAEDRAHRIGQKGNVTVYYLVAKDTVEEKLCDMLQEKQSIVDNTLDGHEEVGNLDLRDQLLKEIQNGR